MKNIHILPTDKPSRVYKVLGNELKYTVRHFEQKGLLCINQNINITSDEEIKEGDWCYDKLLNSVFQFELGEANDDYINKNIKKIILTTDQDLIKVGVQAIDDEFLEWFVKNPSCESIEVAKTNKLIDLYADKEEDKWEVKYHIYIPKEEPKERLKKILGTKHPKQETLEDVAYRLYPIILEDDGWDKNKQYRDEWTKGAKWQQKNSEEEVIQLVSDWTDYRMSEDSKSKVTFKKWFEKFKK